MVAKAIDGKQSCPQMSMREFSRGGGNALYPDYDGGFMTGMHLSNS